MQQEDIFKILNIENLTDSQKQAVLETKTPILVSASAGSGKTFILTKRYIYRILSSKNIRKVKKILVLTFAKAAAQEMFNRINNEILNISEKNKNLIKIKNMLSKNFITTIDSFCYKIVKENFKLCNINPNFKIVSNAEINPLKNFVLDFIFQKEINKNKNSFQQLCDYFSLSSDNELKEAIIKIYEKSKTMPFPLEYIKSLKENFKAPKDLENSEFLKEIKDDMKDKLDEIKNLLNMTIYSLEKDITTKNSFKPSLEQTIKNIEKIEYEIENSTYEETKNIVENFDFESFKKYNKKTNPFDKELAEEIKKNYITPAKIIKDSLKEYITPKEQYLKDFNEQKNFALKLIDLSIKFYNKLELEKRKKNILEFSDLLIKTIDLFIECSKKNERKLTAIGKKYSLKFDEILIDEFQDINESQNLLIKILSNNDKKLFMVGDLKQSIYGFRDANPSIFIDRRNLYSKNPSLGTLIFLNKNFRSRKEVTNSVNFLFSQIMSLDFGRVNYVKTEKLISNKNLELNEKNATEIHILKNEGEEENEEFEISHIANLIKNIIDSKFEILEGKTKRICQPKDFAVLFRSGKNATKLLSKKLLELNISSISFSDINCFSSYEISLLISILKVINNHSLDIPFYHIATSFMFNFSKEEMLKIRIKNFNQSFYDSFKNSKEKKCQKVVEFIKEITNSLNTNKLDELIEKIYNNNLFLKIYTQIDFDETKEKNKEIFLSIAKNYDEYEKYGLLGFLEYIKDIESEKIEIVNKTKNNKNAVTITTIHKSKGLEWPIVILAQTAKMFNEQDFKKPILISSKFNLTLKHSKKENLIRYTTLAFNSAAIFEKKIQKEEELRLLYVAMTRAKDKLILVATDSKNKLEKIKNNKFKDVLIPTSHCKNKKSFFELIISGFLRHENFPFSNETLNFKDENLNCQIQIKTKQEETKAKIKPEKEQEFKTKSIIKNLKKQMFIPKKEEEIFKTKLSVTEIVKLKNKKPKENFILKDLNFNEIKKATPSQKGTAMHVFLQYTNFKNAEKNLNSEIKRLVENEFITKNQAKMLDKEKLKKFFFSYTYKLIKNADSIEREKSFLCEIDSNKIFKNSNNKILVQGIIDLLIEKNKKIILIDYKTDELSEKLLVYKYRPQLYLYKLALEEFFKKPVAFSILHSIYLNKAIFIK